MAADASQEAVVTIEATVRRLVPCGEHAKNPPGVQQERRNPNGYHHDCAACASTPATQEALEV